MLGKLTNYNLDPLSGTLRVQSSVECCIKETSNKRNGSAFETHPTSLKYNLQVIATSYHRYRVMTSTHLIGQYIRVTSQDNRCSNFIPLPANTLLSNVASKR